MLCKVNEDGSLSEVASNGGGLINDEKTSENETWSSKKINDSLVGLEDNEIRRITKAENTASDFSIDSHEGSWITKYIEHELLAGHGTFPSEAYEWIQIEQYKSYDFVRQICTIYNANGLKKTFIRGAWCNATKIENAVWSAWQELATMDKVAKYPDYSRRITMTANTWVATEDVYVTFLRMDSNQLPSADSIKINNIGVGSTDFDGSGSNVGVVTFSGYVRKGSTIESSALQNPSSCKIYPLI